MRITETIYIISLFYLILSCGNVDESEDSRAKYQNRSLKIEHNNVDSVYIKFDHTAKFNMDILSIKSGQNAVKPDTNYKAYFFDKSSNLMYFPIPIEIIYPISPGDSLVISIKNNLPYIKVVNNKKYSDREMNLIAELSSKNISIFEYLLKRKGSLDDAYKATLNYIDSLGNNGELSEDYVQWFKREAEYSYLTWTLTKNIKAPVVDVTEKLNIDSNLNIRNYKSFLWRRMDNLLNKDYSIKRIIQVAESNFTGASKDYVLYKFAIESLSNLNAVHAKSAVAELDGHFEDNNYLSLLKSRYLETYNTASSIVDQLLQPDGQTITFEKMLSKYKGKKIYIDVWASWCAPCRAEMQPSRVLKKNLERQHNVVFIYLSTDKVQNDWLKANKEEELGITNSYLIINPSESSFLKQNQISAIPRYLILDEKGNLVSGNAPRPSSKEIGLILKM